MMQSMMISQLDKARDKEGKNDQTDDRERSRICREPEKGRLVLLFQFCESGRKGKFVVRETTMSVNKSS